MPLGDLKVIPTTSETQRPLLACPKVSWLQLADLDRDEA
jgi:hypothetical protein